MRVSQRWAISVTFALLALPAIFPALNPAMSSVRLNRLFPIRMPGHGRCSPR
jgi:hypothetical protein